MDTQSLRQELSSAGKMSAADLVFNLPESRTRHWLARHKAEIVAAVSADVLTLEEACARYSLTPEEFASWRDAIAREGLSGLAAKSIRERRRAARTALEEPATLLLNGNVRIPCLITNISARGARLQLRSAAELPRSFDLKCRRTRRSVRVQVAWRRGGSVGVAFDTSLVSSLAMQSGLDAWLLDRPA